MKKENSDSESDIYNKMQVINEKDAEINSRQRKLGRC